MLNIKHQAKYKTNEENHKQSRTPNYRFLLSHCGELLTEVLENPSFPADILITRFFRDRKYLGSRDRGFISDNIYSILRNIFFYDFILHGDYTVKQIIILHCIKTNLVPDERMLCEAMEIDDGDIPKVKKLVKTALEKIETLTDIKRCSILFSLPEFIVERIFKEHNLEWSEKLFESLNKQAPITLRTNTLVTDREELIVNLMAQGIPSGAGKISKDSIILQRRINANALIEFKEGHFELQDEGSQMICELLDPKPTSKIFDACAGSGGKALHLSALMKGRGSIIIHDTNARRLGESKTRLKRSTVQNVRTMNNEEYLENKKSLVGKFDIVLIDAPCTGAGVLRRNPGARMNLDVNTLERMIAVQTDVLNDYSQLVKKGGYLLYATCSLLTEENELQIENFLEKNKEWKIKPFKSKSDILSNDGSMRLWSHIHGTDCFYSVLLEKK
ncbi:MAG: RsmB/NOP family class I SAM-dependent RNA methyltransferase [Chlorobiota bacterium]|jgi:16S rRNA (cytosine967-C5)-methyltransferase|nr:RsmB/NOP family class I SAM-dependent RNA methyltransferase [Chlorobiota bacterium]QQS66752.1 MAG: RsmB/NOP family class I SAM-dependent RNA methyltransferase [Chlorobiota bacterium]